MSDSKSLSSAQSRFLFLFRVFMCNDLILVRHPFRHSLKTQFGPENTTNDHNYSILQNHFCWILFKSNYEKQNPNAHLLTYPPSKNSPLQEHSRLNDIVRLENTSPIFHYLFVILVDFFLFFWILDVRENSKIPIIVQSVTLDFSCFFYSYLCRCLPFIKKETPIMSVCH